MQLEQPTFADWLDKLNAHGFRPKQTGAMWRARCPAHDSTSHSLSFSPGSKQSVVARCFVGCTYQQVRKALFPEIDFGAIAQRSPKRESTPAEKRHQDRLRRERLREGHRAARVAQRIVEAAPLDTHPYLESKGFESRLGLVWPDGELLLVPMFRERTLVSVQGIRGDGRKRFLPMGCHPFGAIHQIGRRRGTGRLWLVEGYATGLSVHAALRGLYRKDDEVRVCFSTHALATEGRRLRGGLVIADHDTVKQNGKRPGLEAAEKTGLPYWYPPQVGDANDWHQSSGLGNLTDALRDLVRLNPA